MTSASQEPVMYARGRSAWAELLKITELWASLAIVAMWIAVACAAVWGPNFVTADASGGSTTIPSGVAVALFAFLGSWAGFIRRTERP